LIELDPLYVDVIIRRWQAYAHDDAILVSTGQTFDDIEKNRRMDEVPCGFTLTTASTGDAEPSHTATARKDAYHV
jgi:hypothetical protein